MNPIKQVLPSRPQSVYDCIKTTLLSSPQHRNPLELNNGEQSTRIVSRSEAADLIMLPEDSNSDRNNSDSDSGNSDSDSGNSDDSSGSDDDMFANRDGIDHSAVTSNPVFYDTATKTYYPLNGIRPITPSYIDIASQEPVLLTINPKKLIKKLVILDLNGTLFYRADSHKRTVYPRPHLRYFLQFLFQNFLVMIWSSARPSSVQAMLKCGFGGYENRLERVWSRDHFKLHHDDYNRKVLTLKDLEIVWREIEAERHQRKVMQALDPTLPNEYTYSYDQTNTILIDDSVHKSQLQPYNCVVLTDFNEHQQKVNTDTELLKVRHYLQKLIQQENVSAYIKRHPFDSNSEEYSVEPYLTDSQAIIDRGLMKKQRKVEKKKAKAAKLREIKIRARVNVEETVAGVDGVVGEKAEFAGEPSTGLLENCMENIASTIDTKDERDVPASTNLSTLAGTKKVSKPGKRQRKRMREAADRVQQAENLESTSLPSSCKHGDGQEDETSDKTEFSSPKRARLKNKEKLDDA
ncbi:hypothetical protein EDD11_006022 [Mortierella claussenii]|nr:hypothetical protein EDD11_006022 [Mortierella claussenii]